MKNIFKTTFKFQVNPLIKNDVTTKILLILIIPKIKLKMYFGCNIITTKIINLKL